MTGVNPNWKQQAYPLKQITIKRQGSKHSTLDDLLSQLQHIAKRVNAGDTLGYDHDDDFGYWFNGVNETDNTFFDEPAGYP